MTYQVTNILQQIEQQLIKDNLWSHVSPSPTQLASSQPFATDTLSIEQWLQFIFIPQMQYLLINNAELPKQINITPIIQQYYRGNQAKLIALIQKIEAICTQNLTVKN